MHDKQKHLSLTQHTGHTTHNLQKTQVSKNMYNFITFMIRKQVASNLERKLGHLSKKTSEH